MKKSVFLCEKRKNIFVRIEYLANSPCPENMFLGAGLLVLWLASWCTLAGSCSAPRAWPGPFVGAPGPHRGAGYSLSGRLCGPYALVAPALRGGAGDGVGGDAGAQVPDGDVGDGLNAVADGEGFSDASMDGNVLG